MNKYLPINIVLQVAKEFDGKALTQLTMRPPTTNDVILSQHHATRVLADGSSHMNEAEAEMHLFAALTGTTREFIGQLEYYDYTQLGKGYDCFLLPLSQYAARCALLFPDSATESHSPSLEVSASESSATGLTTAES
ncbi:TPA: phage tail assembly protein [Vibrio vulnificus]|nr:phage tail assembly protein [Vibrio vulnificus]